MKIYTRKGDLGETSLIGGVRVSKAQTRLHAYGTVDELNSFVGLVRDVAPQTQIAELLLSIQDNLFVIGSNLAAHPEKSHMQLPDVAEAEVERLEQAIDGMNEEMPPIAHFILPGGHLHVSYCHLARTVCRRAERWAVALHAEEGSVQPMVIKYLNRLSDYFFVLGRYYGHLLEAEEVLWQPERKKQDNQ